MFHLCSEPNEEITLFKSTIYTSGTFLVVQWLGPHASIAGCESSNPTQRTKIRHAS